MTDQETVRAYRKVLIHPKKAFPKDAMPANKGTKGPDTLERSTDGRKRRRGE